MTSKNKTKIATLWFGDPITKIQETSLLSFIFYGHDISIFLYDQELVVPRGVNKLDANEIMPLQDSRYRSSFSDVFRLKMMEKTNFHWVDADTICISKKWFGQDETYLVQQKNGEVQAPVSRLPQNSDILNFLINEIEKINIRESEWNDSNSNVFLKALEVFPEYRNYLIDEDLVNGVSYQEYWKFFDPLYKDEILNFKENAKSVTPFNGMLTRHNIDKNFFPIGSAIQYFYNKFSVVKA